MTKPVSTPVSKPLTKPFKIWDFPGGIHPAEEKDLSNGSVIASMPLPERLYVPLKQRTGGVSEPLVVAGEKVLKGQLLADSADPFGIPIHAPTSGVITQITDIDGEPLENLGDAYFWLQCDGNDEWEERLPTLTESAPAQQLLERIRFAGIAGLGGASFPAHIKLKTDAAIDTLIINAVECEPYITCDDRLMRDRADEIVAGIKILDRILELERIVIAIEDNKPEAIASMREATAGLLKVQVAVVPTKYPSGGEKQLIQIVTGKEVPSGQVPAAMGIVMHNVGTCAAIHRAVNQGEALLSRIVTVTGRAPQKPGNYEVLLGTPIQHLLDHTLVSDSEQIIMGGPMMGAPISDTRLPVVKASNCIIATAAGELTEETQPLPCIRCGACAEVCPANLLPQQLYWHAKAQDDEKLEEYQLMDCIECGACAYICPSHIPLVHYYRFAKQSIRAAQADRQKAEQARERFEFRNMRLERAKAERAERHRKAAEARRKAAEKSGETDEKKAAIAAALARVNAKKKTEPEPES